MMNILFYSIDMKLSFLKKLYKTRSFFLKISYIQLLSLRRWSKQGPKDKWDKDLSFYFDKDSPPDILKILLELV